MQINSARWILCAQEIPPTWWIEDEDAAAIADDNRRLMMGEGKDESSRCFPCHELMANSSDRQDNGDVLVLVLQTVVQCYTYILYIASSLRPWTIE